MLSVKIQGRSAVSKIVKKQHALEATFTGVNGESQLLPLVHMFLIEECNKKWEVDLKTCKEMCSLGFLLIAVIRNCMQLSLS